MKQLFPWDFCCAHKAKSNFFYLPSDRSLVALPACTCFFSYICTRSTRARQNLTATPDSNNKEKKNFSVCCIWLNTMWNSGRNAGVCLTASQRTVTHLHAQSYRRVNPHTNRPGLRHGHRREHMDTQRMSGRLSHQFSSSLDVVLSLKLQWRRGVWTDLPSQRRMEMKKWLVSPSVGGGAGVRVFSGDEMKCCKNMTSVSCNRWNKAKTKVMKMSSLDPAN